MTFYLSPETMNERQKALVERLLADFVKAGDVETISLARDLRAKVLLSDTSDNEANIIVSHMNAATHLFNLLPISQRKTQLADLQKRFG